MNNLELSGDDLWEALLKSKHVWNLVSRDMVIISKDLYNSLLKDSEELQRLKETVVPCYKNIP